MVVANIKTGGKQIITQVGKNIFVEKLDKKVGEKVVFDQVLLIQNDKDNIIGTPIVKTAKVVGTIKKQGKQKKVIIFRTKAKSNWKRTMGHRQTYTNVLIEEISYQGKVLDKISPKLVKKDEAKKSVVKKDVKKPVEKNVVNKNVIDIKEKKVAPKEVKPKASTTKKTTPKTSTSKPKVTTPKTSTSKPKATTAKKTTPKTSTSKPKATTAKKTTPKTSTTKKTSTK